MNWLVGKKGYVALTEDELRRELEHPHALDLFIERHSDRPVGRNYRSFWRATASQNTNFIRVGVLRLFEKRKPYLVGAGLVSESPGSSERVYSSPIVAHNNAGMLALNHLRGKMLGMSLMGDPRYVAMFSGDAGPKKADCSAIVSHCQLSTSHVPMPIRGDGWRMLNGAPHQVGWLDARQRQSTPVQTSSKWGLQITPEATISPNGDWKIALPIRLGQATERRYAEGELLAFEDDVDVSEIDEQTKDNVPLKIA